MIDWLSRDEQVIYFGQNLALLTETLFITAEVLLKGQEIQNVHDFFPFRIVCIGKNRFSKEVTKLIAAL